MPVAPAQSPLLAAQNVPAPLFIQAGASNAQHLADAGEYREEVKRRRLCHPPSAADADESAAKVYESEIATDLSPGLQAMMTAALIKALPNALLNALPNALAVALAPIHAQLANLTGQVANQGAQLTNQGVQLAKQADQLQKISNHLTDIGALLANQKARDLNAHLYAKIDLTQAHSRIRPIVKEIAGHPPRSPNDPRLVIAAIGDSFPSTISFAPTTSSAIYALTDPQIDDLSWFHNVEFAPGAPIAERQQAVLNFYII
ncbi:hypothetical protein HDU79_005158 [Rhizoclosmatium sp. JEL0117]|nr:hypothetical protein HDU79_005158 [Rhizoclosmatium sp. JEL0117]